MPSQSWPRPFGGAKPETDLQRPRDIVSSRSVTQEINSLLRKAGAGSEQTVDDITYLRRVFLDLIGENPTPAQIADFARNPSLDKREAAVERLLADPQFGKNWGRYWRDVILARRSDDRALLLVANSVTTTMAKKINQDISWRDIASSFITATGDVRDHGETGVLLAQKGDPEEIASEVTRIFMGMQIQCAQCHDHPSENWAREQFHQLAAFFPRVGVRKVPNSQKRSFEVFSRDRKKGGGKKRNNRLEHYMPDLEDPQAKGTLTQPVFFLTGQSLELGTPDVKRRKALANWITDPNRNPWFARAYVNRIWAELVGRGFYEPIDDLGEEREGMHVDVLNFLADRFAAEGYDTKWLFRTIMATDSYQGLRRPQRNAAVKSTVSSCPQPLRSDQLFNAFAAALDINDSPGNNAARGKGSKRDRARARTRFNQIFFYDPSLPRDEINPTIPQALMMMNDPRIDQLMRGDRRGTMLGKMLSTEIDNGTIIEQLYLRCLAREPTQQERSTCLEHIKKTGTRTEACEDILWALINSAEFRYRK